MAYNDLDYINYGPNYVYIPYGHPDPARLIRESGPPGQPKIPVYGGPPGSGASRAASGPKELRIGMVQDGTIIRAERMFVRFKISDLPGSLPSVRLQLQYKKKSNPTGNVALIHIADFGTLDPSDYGIAEYSTVTATAITPATAPDTKLSLDVTASYNASKANGDLFIAYKLQYSDETEGVGFGRWYLVGATGNVAPQLVVLITQGKDVRCELIATAVTVETSRLDELGTPATTVRFGDDDVYPALGEGVQVAATLTGVTDDATGTYTGTPTTPIVQGPDIIHYLLRHPTQGAGIPPGDIDVDAFRASRARLDEMQWFPLMGGLKSREDVRGPLARIARSCRSFVYVDQMGRESIYTEPVGGSGQVPIRLVRPQEHGAIRLYPLLDPLTRIEVEYGFDHLELNGFESHAILWHPAGGISETEPPDDARDAQVRDAAERYGVRDPGAGSDSYEWVPDDEPGVATGVRIRDLIWDRAQALPIPLQGLDVDLPLFAAGWRLMDEFEIESFVLPTSAARRTRSSTHFTGEVDPTTPTYRARRALCSVRAMPVLLAESTTSFPVRISAQIIQWETV